MRQLRRPAITVVIALSLLASACDPKVLRESRKAAHRIQVTIDASIDTLTVLHSKQLVSDAQTKTIALALVKVNDANGVLIAHVKAASSDTPQTRQQLLADLQDIVKSVEALKATGILGIKSENGSLAFESAINALLASIEILKGALQ
jgi:hypothetical protein